jgi:hypothetical protein
MQIIGHCGSKSYAKYQVSGSELSTRFVKTLFLVLLHWPLEK